MISKQKQSPPSPQQPSAQIQQELPKKSSEPIKQFWSEHRLTLIAYQAQYIYAKQPNQQRQERRQNTHGHVQAENQQKKKAPRKKVNLQFQSAFLSISQQESDDFKVEELIKPYDSLNWLFTMQQDENFMSVREFIKILLELKHSCIVKEFCEIYNTIVRELKTIQFLQVEKQDSRFQLLQNIKNKIVAQIQNKKDKFKYFVRYLRDDEKETKQLILVEAYCIIAQRFNFNINEFYSDAFAVSFDGKPTKKVKKTEA